MIVELGKVTELTKGPDFTMAFEAIAPTIRRS
jgi:hypothetical protein